MTWVSRRMTSVSFWPLLNVNYVICDSKNYKNKLSSKLSFRWRVPQLREFSIFLVVLGVFWFLKPLGFLDPNIGNPGAHSSFLPELVTRRIRWKDCPDPVPSKTLPHQVLAIPETTDALSQYFITNKAMY